MRVHEEHSAHTAYDVLKAAIEERIQATLSHVEPHTLRKAMEHGAYGGKMIRPLVSMLACASVGGRETAALDVATAIELLHTSSLIHDDIMDESPLRRGVPTTHTTYGIPMAILAGDTFVALAFQLMQSLRAPNKDRINRMFVDSFRAVCEGQGFDLCLTCFECPEQGMHKKMVEKKTAKLLEAASAIGALVGTINEAHIQALAQYGYNLGMAFQAQDDLLDTTGNEQTMGKPGRLDVKNQKHTFLTLAYPGHVEENMMKGISAVEKAVQEYTNRATSSLEVLPPTDAREMLHLLAESLTRRLE